MDPISNLKMVQMTLNRQRFAGLDQNPGGIHDLLGVSIHALETRMKAVDDLMNALAEARAFVVDHVDINSNGGPNRAMKLLPQLDDVIAAAKAAGIKVPS